MANETAIYEEKMTKTIAALDAEFNTIRAGRANPHVLDRITVDYYGTPTPINQVGNITVPEARLIQIQPWDASLLKAIEKAINTSELGINPSKRRKELTKDVKKKSEATKVAIRNIRRDAIDAFKKMEKKKEIPEDELKSLEEKIQKITDKFIAEIDKKTESKCKDILSV